MGLSVSSATDLVGLIGVLLYIGAYAAMQFGLLRGQTYTYAILNALAAGCVLLSLQVQFNLSSAIIQIFWILISLGGMLRLFWLSHRIRFTPEEQALLDAKLSLLSPSLARKFLDSGYWIEGGPGTELTKEGEPVSDLIYLAKGEAQVNLGGHVIGFCGAETFIGEITCLKGDPASATVSLHKPSRYFCIGAVKLRSLCARNNDLRWALEQSFAMETGKKLLAANEMQRELMARTTG